MLLFYINRKYSYLTLWVIRNSCEIHSSHVAFRLCFQCLLISSVSTLATCPHYFCYTTLTYCAGLHKIVNNEILGYKNGSLMFHLRIQFTHFTSSPESLPISPCHFSLRSNLCWGYLFFTCFPIPSPFQGFLDNSDSSLRSLLLSLFL